MEKKILILIDNSKIMEKVVEYVHTLFQDATLYLLSFINLGYFANYYSKTVLTEMRNLSEESLNKIELFLESKNAKFQSEILIGDPVSILLSYAKRKSVDLIVLETHAGKSVNKIKIGSTTYNLLVNSHIPVLLLSENLEIKKPEKILHPTSGSKYSEIATKETGELASYWKSDVEVLVLREPKDPIAKKSKNILKTYNITLNVEYSEESEINSILKRSEFNDIIIGSRGSPRPTYKIRTIFKTFSLDPTLKILIAFLPKPLLLICD